jgi:hypothetical protein
MVSDLVGPVVRSGQDLEGSDDGFGDTLSQTMTDDRMLMAHYRAGRRVRRVEVMVRTVANPGVIE